MRQGVILKGYAGLTVGLMLASGVGCRGGLSSISPVGFVPVDRATVVGWIADFSVSGHRRYDLRPWRYINESGAAGGRAQIRIAAPDSLRFDYRGGFGASGNAVVVGDSTIWSTEETFDRLMAMAPLFWAAMGLPRVPPDSAPVRAIVGGDFRAVRYILAADTFDFVLRGLPVTRMEGEMRRAGRVLGQSIAEIDAVSGLVVSSRIDFWDVSRFEFTVEMVDTLTVLDASVWQRQ